METPTVPEVYLHPKYKNVKVWDLPAIGTPNFKADEYLKLVQFERYDFFIIIASDRFRECHTQLAKEIKNMGKKFYFVRSKIDFCITAEKRKKNFDQKKTLDTVREDCENGLRKIGIQDPVVFLISSFELGKYDLNQLQERMEKELPQHKRRVLMLALPNITLAINEKKKKALEANIGKVAFLSACVHSRRCQKCINGFSGNCCVNVTERIRIEITCSCCFYSNLHLRGKKYCLFGLFFFSCFRCSKFMLVQ